MDGVLAVCSYFFVLLHKKTYNKLNKVALASYIFKNKSYAREENNPGIMYYPPDNILFTLFSIRRFPLSASVQTNYPKY